MIKKKDGTEQLKEFVHRWECHKIFCEYMRRLFLPIDNGALQQGQGPKDSISALGLRQFKNYLWDIGKKDIVNTMLGLIHDHRITDRYHQRRRNFSSDVRRFFVSWVSSRPRIFQAYDVLWTSKRQTEECSRSCPCCLFWVILRTISAVRKQPHGIRVVEHLKFYHEEFQDPLLAATKAYCASLRDEWLTSKSTPEYFRKFHDLFDG